MPLLTLLSVQATIIASVVTAYNLYLHRKSFKVYRWWVGGLWVQHRGARWMQCLWLIEAGYVIDELSHSYHLTFRTVTKFENYTKEGYTL